MLMFSPIFPRMYAYHNIFLKLRSDNIEQFLPLQLAKSQIYQLQFRVFQFTSIPIYQFSKI